MTGPELVRQCNAAWPEREWAISTRDTSAKRGVYTAKSKELPAVHVKVTPQHTWAVLTDSGAYCEGESVASAIAELRDDPWAVTP